MANIIDTGIEIAGPPDLIRATLDRILERSVVVGDGETNERGYHCENYSEGSEHNGPVTWFHAADLRQPTILNEWSDERHRVSISTESKWDAPWKLIHELIQAGLDVRAVWKDDDGYLTRCPAGDGINWDVRNYGGFGEIRSYRNGELFKTAEEMFESYKDRPSFISIIEGDTSDHKLGFVEYRANGDEWLEFSMIAPGVVKIRMGKKQSNNVQELVLGSPLFPIAHSSNSLVQIKSTGITITNSGEIEPRTEVN